MNKIVTINLGWYDAETREEIVLGIVENQPQSTRPDCEKCGNMTLTGEIFKGSDGTRYTTCTLVTCGYLNTIEGNPS